MRPPSPIRQTDDAARALAQDILNSARFGALALQHPVTSAPYVSRVALLWHQGAIITLVSTLSTHTKGLMAHPHCAVLLGEVGTKGDPLTHPRMTITCVAEPTDKAQHRLIWLAAMPKAQLYFDFADFVMMQLTPQTIDLNGGFGKAFTMQPTDITL